MNNVAEDIFKFKRMTFNIQMPVFLVGYFINTADTDNLLKRQQI